MQWLKHLSKKLSRKSKVALMVAVLVGGQVVAGAAPFMPAPSAFADTNQTISAKALVNSDPCNSTSQWQFVITQIDTQADAPATITVKWANGQTETVALTSFTGQTAHYVVSQSSNSYVTSATAQIYSGWSGEFNLSDVQCTAVTPVTPTLTTQASAASFTLGGSVSDTATLTGTQANGAVTGIVDFYVCGPSGSAQGCASTATQVGGDVTVSSGQAVSASFTPAATGIYCFLAIYTPVNTADYLATSETNTTTECFSMTAPAPVAPVITTKVSAASVTLPQTVTDTATVTGSATNGAVTGSVSFYLCSSATPITACATGGTSAGTVALTPAATVVPSSTATSAALPALAPGYYCVRAEYAPDNAANYLSATETDFTDECFQAIKPAVPTGSITIKKDARPKSTQPFQFVITGPSNFSDNFSLIDDSMTGLPRQKYPDLPAGTYTIKELPTGGWDFAGISCTYGSSTVSTSGSTLTINLAAKDNVVCIYTNRERGTITVYKVTDPAGNTTGFPISISSSTGGTINGSTSRILSTTTPVTYDVSQGIYNVSEDLSNLPGWQTTKNTCLDLQVSSTRLHRTCKIVNTLYTSISGTKWEVNADGSTVGTTGLSGWTINLYKNGVLDATTVTGADGAYSFLNLVANGTYTVEEVQQPGWTQICGPTPFTTVCTQGANDFGNFQNAKIKGFKWDDLNGDGKHQSTEPKLSGWTIQLKNSAGTVLSSDVTDATGYYSFDDLAPGTYDVCEVMQPGWTQTYPATASGCRKLKVDTSGYTYTANFGNEQQQAAPPTGTITIVKVANPSTNQFFSFTTNANQAGSFSLSGSNSANSSETFTVPLSDTDPNAPSAYTFTENPTLNWKLENVQCNSNFAWTVAGNTLSVNLSTDLPNVTCTFTNNQQGQVLGISTTTPGGSGSVLGAQQELVNTGSNPLIGWIIGGSVIAAVLALGWDSWRQRGRA